MGDEACLKLSTTSCCSSSVRPPCRMTACLGPSLRSACRWLSQPLQGADALGEDHHPHRAARADAELAQVGEQPGVLARASVVRLARQRLEPQQRLDLPFLGGRRVLAQAADALLDGLEQRGRGGEERLGQGPGEERGCGPRVRGAAGRRVQPHRVELARHLVLRVGGGHEPVLRLLALGPVRADLAGDLGAVPVPPDDQAAHLVLDDRAVRAHGGRLEQPDQLGEGLRLAVVRRGRREDQRVGVRREHAGELVVQRLGVGHVVGLVDDDRVPGLPPQVVQVLPALERVDRDDDALEVAERVAGGGQLLADPLDAERVQPDERDREPRPHLVLHLLKHVPGRDDQDPLAAAAPDQLGQDHADLERLAKPHRVGEQDARAQVRLVEGLAHGGLLVAERVGEHVDADREGGPVERHRGLAQRRLEPQPGAPVVRRVVGHHARLGGVEHAQVGVEALVEAGGGVPDQLRQALAAQQPPVGGVLDAGDQPFLVPHDDHRARGDADPRRVVQGGQTAALASAVSPDEVIDCKASKKLYQERAEARARTVMRARFCLSCAICR